MAVSFVAGASATSGTGSTVTASLTVSGTNPVLTFKVWLHSATAVVNSVGWGPGGTGTRVISVRGTNGVLCEHWAVPAPVAGAGTITANLSASVLSGGHASCFGGADQATPCPTGNAVSSLLATTPQTLTPTGLTAADASEGFGANIIAGNWNAATPNQLSIDNGSDPGSLSGYATGTTGVTLTNDGTMTATNIALVAIRIAAASTAVSWRRPQTVPPYMRGPRRGKLVRHRTWADGTASSDVTVALTGVTGTYSTGSLIPSSSVALTGQAGTYSTGTLAPSTTVALAGQTGAYSTGSLTPSSSINLTGVTGAWSTGTLTPSTTVALSGQTGTWSTGTVTATTGGDVTVALTGQAGNYSTGTLSPQTTVALVGTAGSYAMGSMTPSPSVSLAGVTGAYSVGQLTPSTAVPLTGQTGTWSTGSLTAQAGGDVTVALTGIQGTWSTGQLTASGGDSPITPGGGASGGGGGSIDYQSHKPRKAHLRKQIDEILDSAEAAYRALLKGPEPEAAAKIIKPFAEDKREAVPPPEEIDWTAVERDVTRTRRLIAMATKLELQRQMDEDDDDFLLLH